MRLPSILFTDGGNQVGDPVRYVKGWFFFANVHFFFFNVRFFRFFKRATDMQCPVMKWVVFLQLP